MNATLFIICYVVFLFIGILHIIHYIRMRNRFAENFIDELSIMKSIVGSTVIVIAVIVMLTNFTQR